MKSLKFYENHYEQRLLTSLGLNDKTIMQTFKDQRFSVHNLRRTIFHEAYTGQLKENAETTFGQLLRGGIQALAADYFNYEAGNTQYQDIVDIRPTTKYAEFYAPMWGQEIPREVGVDGRFAESQIHGTSSMIVSRKFGRLYTFNSELWEDDQTGEIKRKASQMGAGMRVLQELYFSARILGERIVFPEGVTVQLPQILGANVYLANLWGTVGGITYGNRPASTNVVLSARALEATYVSFLNARDPYNRRIMINPTVLMISGHDYFTAQRLLTSTVQPMVPDVSDQGTGAVSAQFTGGATGWTNTANPLKGLYNLKVSRYFPAYRWLVGEPKKGLILQDREPMSIVQENPASGESFSRDRYVFRVKARWEMDWIVGSNNFWYKGYCTS